MIFLQSHGVGTTRTRIFKTYEEEAIAIVSKNPYQLAKDIIRARAGLSHVLLEATSSGHCALPLEILIENTRKLLGIDSSLVELAVTKELELKTIICDLIED